MVRELENALPSYKPREIYVGSVTQEVAGCSHLHVELTDDPTHVDCQPSCRYSQARRLLFICPYHQKSQHSLGCQSSREILANPYSGLVFMQTPEEW